MYVYDDGLEPGYVCDKSIKVVVFYMCLLGF